MKIKLLLVVSIFMLFISNSFAQFDKPSFQLGLGVVNPDMQMRGTGNDYINYTDRFRYYFGLVNPPIDTTYILPFQMALVDSNLYMSNMGGKTGFYISGMAKINVDKYDVFRLVGSLSFSAFNAFQPTKSGYIPYLTQTYFNQRNIEYDYSLSNFGIGLGLEIAPLAFTKVVSPFINGNVTFNFINAKLSRTTGPNDSISYNASAFRMGLNLNTGLEFRINPQWGFVLGAKYDFGNLLFKNSNRSSVLEWGNSAGEINDEAGGYFQTNLFDPPGTPFRDRVQNSSKTLNWATFYIGVNFYPQMKQTPPKK